MSINRKFIEIVKLEKEKQCIGNEKLANEVGCTSQAIRYWLRGLRGISLEKADEVLKVLGVSIEIGKTDDN